MHPQYDEEGTLPAPPPVVAAHDSEVTGEATLTEATGNPVAASQLAVDDGSGRLDEL